MNCTYFYLLSSRFWYQSDNIDKVDLSLIAHIMSTLYLGYEIKKQVILMHIFLFYHNIEKNKCLSENLHN